MENANLKLLAAMACLIVLVAAIGLWLGGGITVPKIAADGEEPLLITATEGLLLPAATGANQPEAQAYLLIQADGSAYEPVPILAEGLYTFTLPDGGVNCLRVTPQSIVMESADCSTQDCVHQGLVNLDTLTFRPLGGQIICLPHKLIVELIPAEDLGSRIILTPGEVVP